MILLIGRNLIRRNNKGFTFIELLLVVVILGAVAGLSVPRFSKTYSNLLLTDTSHNLTYLMRYAQMRTVAERANHRLNFNLDRSKYWLTKETDDNEFIRLGGKFGKIFEINEQLNLECDCNLINFYPDGKIDKIQIYLSNKNNKFYTISTEAQSGYVREFDFKR